MTKFLILHGTDGSPKSNRFMWLKGILIGRGFEVWLPELPNSKTPNTATYNKFLLSNPEFSIDDETIIIGHSSGAVEILNLLQHLPEGSNIKAAILVSSFKDNLDWPTLDGLFAEPFDFSVIKQRSPSFIFIHSNNDPYCPIEHAKYLAEQTGGKLITIEGQGHFNTELGPQYKQFPEIIDIINDII